MSGAAIGAVIAIAGQAAAAQSSSQPAITVHAPRSAKQQASPDRSVQLSAAQMLAVADAAEARGDKQAAATIYAALENDPNHRVRNEARFRHAKQLIAVKRYSAAAILLRRIVDEEPRAARVRLELASVLHELGDNDGALAQLRAARAGSLPPSVSRLIDRFSEALRAQRPFGASFEVALAPDSNINRATRSDTLGTVLGDFDINDSSKAKSGTGVAIQTSVYRRFRLHGDKSALLVRSSGLANLYGNKQFNDIALDLSVGPEFRVGLSQVNLELGATQRWFGQKPFLRSGRLAMTVSRPLGPRMQLRLYGAASLIDNRLNDLQDGKDFSGQASVERALSPTTGIVLRAGADRQTARDPAYATKGWNTGTTLWHDFGRMTLAVGADVRRLDADARLALFPEVRSDRFSSFSLAATFRQLQFHGFAPLFRLSVERNRSTIEIYDYHRRRMEMGVVRAF